MKNGEKLISGLLLLTFFACLVAGFPPANSDPMGVIPNALYFLAQFYLPFFLVLVTFISPIITPKQTKHHSFYMALTSTTLTALLFFAALAWHSYAKSWFWLLLGNIIFLFTAIYDVYNS